MARTITEIQDEIIVNVNTDLPELTSTSQVSLWRKWTFIVATAIGIEEQLWDVFKADLQNIADNAQVGTAQWLQAQALKFQYDAADPQVLVVTDFVPSYPIIDESLQIVEVAAVNQQTNRRVIVKVAKNDGVGGLEPLDATELSAFRSYIKAIQFAGTSVSVASADADRLYIEMEVFYNGQYVQTDVSTNLKAAIDDYVRNLDFDGVINKNGLIDVMQGVAGVVDIKLDILRGRTASDTVGSIDNTTIYNLVSGINNRFYETSAGYVLLEDTPGSEFDDTVTFTIA
jgi:hypothetical protein